MVGSKSRTLRHLQKLIFNTQVSSEDNQYTVHTARILQKPLSVSALSGHQRRDQLNCPLIWAFLKARGAVAVVCGVKTRQTVVRSGDMISVVLVWQQKP